MVLIKMGCMIYVHLFIIKNILKQVNILIAEYWFSKYRYRTINYLLGHVLELLEQLFLNG